MERGTYISKNLTQHQIDFMLMLEDKEIDISMAKRKRTTRLSLDEHHPFEQGLFNNRQHLPEAFANQMDELKNLTRYAKRSRLVGVLGTLGSGKTTLLRHFCSEVILPKSPVIFLRLTPAAQPRPFSQIAIAVLLMCSKRSAKGKIHIDQANKLNLHDERRKLEASLQKEVGLTLEISPEVKVNNLFEAKVAKLTGTGKRTVTYQQQDDSYAINLLQKLFIDAKSRFYIVLDDFHYLRDGEPDSNYYDSFISFAEKVFACLDYSKVTFLLTLDDLVLKRRKTTEDLGGGAAKKYTNEELIVRGFTPKGIYELIQKRIALFNYPQNQRPDFTPESVIALSKACMGNPRRVLDILRDSMDRAEDEGNISVSFENVVSAIRKTDNAGINDFEIDVLRYLSVNGPSSLEESFWKGVNKSRATLQRELPKLVQQDLIAVRSVGTKRNPKQEFYIPTLNGG